MSGSSRASIPDSLRKTIQDIKEIAGKHSDEDVYAMLKECNMDPNETAQKLLYLGMYVYMQCVCECVHACMHPSIDVGVFLADLKADVYLTSVYSCLNILAQDGLLFLFNFADTFHQVKGKRDRKKVLHYKVVGLQSFEVIGKCAEDIEFVGRDKAILQFLFCPHCRVLKTELTKNISKYMSCSGEGPGVAEKTILPLLIILTVYLSFCLYAIGGRPINARRENGYNSYTGRGCQSSVPNLHKKINAAPALASSEAPANGSTSLFNGSSMHELASQLAELYIGGVIKETKADHGNKSRKLPSVRTFVVKQLLAVDPGPTPTPTPTNISIVATRAKIQGGNLNSKSNLGNSISSPSVSGLYSSASDPVLVPSLNPRNSGTVGIIKRATGNQRNSAEISANPLADSRTSVVQNASIEHAVSGSVDLTSNIQSIEFQESERSQLIESSQLPSSASHHIAAGKGNQETCQVNGPSKDILSDASGIATEAKSEVDVKLHKLQNSVRQSVIFPNHLHVPEAFKNSLMFGSLDATLGQNNGDSNSEDASVPNFEAATKEPSPNDHPTSGVGNYPDRPPSPPNVLVNLPSQENISSGMTLRYDQSKQDAMQPVGGSHNSLLPPVMGSHNQKGSSHRHGGNSLTSSTTGSSPSLTQSKGITHSSIANPHQLLSHSGFPQQSSPGNIYIPQTAASGVKFPISPVYKPGNIAGNLTQSGISSAYGSYGPFPPSTSASNDDLAVSELKEKNMHSTIKQNDDLHAFNSTTGRDISPLQANDKPLLFHLHR
ncbi:hypothetical protein BUALT_Bualt03G0103600 [Buddleja alternifolia]|uniref:GBF-interacting protein 1 N-terminal domain-containing protein n=1 Tax=Buddleja alternifolia TaxID=168488 RepID=A0AAV6XSK4_9LAMI|nr:hypothetical protein BUALT_Bualt03G0103600 [Buddleja alternifolia]